MYQPSLAVPNRQARVRHAAGSVPKMFPGDSVGTQKSDHNFVDFAHAVFCDASCFGWGCIRLGYRGDASPR